DRKHIWFTQLGGDVGRFDIEADRVTAVIPLSDGDGPRRLAISEEDIVWVPLYGAGELLKIDARSARLLRRYPLPDRHAAPYRVSWDPRRQKVWVSASNRDAIYRFDPTSERFEEFRFPRRQAYTRTMPIDPQTGDLWSAYANPPSVNGPS